MESRGPECSEVVGTVGGLPSGGEGTDCGGGRQGGGERGQIGRAGGYYGQELKAGI